jgi:putative transposase
MYEWRKMTDSEKENAMKERIQRGGTRRRPPLWNNGPDNYLLSAACYEHSAYIGTSHARLDAFETSLAQLLSKFSSTLFAHVILPNHYHLLVHATNIAELKSAIGRFHGHTSRQWNLEENTPGRQIFHGSAETKMKSERHFYATLNYIHHNPVKHGYVQCWQDWPWSSARDYLKSTGKTVASQNWKAYPINHYGADWDPD